jgi:phosphocarrier protein
MNTLEVTVINRLGLHAPAAAKFVHLASAFSSQTVARDGTRGREVDLGLLTLAASKGTKLHLTVSRGRRDRRRLAGGSFDPASARTRGDDRHHGVGVSPGVAAGGGAPVAARRLQPPAAPA